MTNILRDVDGNSGKIEMYKYCLDKKGRPKPIWPEDMKHAKKMDDGSWQTVKKLGFGPIRNKYTGRTPF